jgi:hypothetical protein
MRIILLIIVFIFFSIGSYAQEKNTVLITINNFEIQDSSLYPVLDSIISILEYCSSDASKNTTDYIKIYVADTHYYSINYSSYYNLNKSNIYNGFMYKDNLFLINNTLLGIHKDIEVVPVCLKPTNKTISYNLKIVSSKNQCDFLLAVVCKKNNCYIDPIVWVDSPNLLKAFKKRKVKRGAQLYHYIKRKILKKN